MDAVEYRRRASIAEPGEYLWRAFDDHLEQIAPDGRLVSTVPYRNVRKVRVAFAPGRMQQTRYLMELSGQGSRLVLTNMHFVGFAQFEDRFSTFAPLMRKVIEGVSRANPAAEFQAGEKVSYYWLMMLFNAAAFGLLALVLFALPVGVGDFTTSAILKLVVILFSLPLMFGWATKAFPRRFDPHTGLDKVLAAR